MSERISKIDLWNTFYLGGNKFAHYKRDELINRLSRSVVTYWIANGYLRSVYIRKYGRRLALTQGGIEHLINSTSIWLARRPAMLDQCNHIHPSFRV